MKKLFILFVLSIFATPAIAGNSNSFFLGNDAALTGGAIAAHTRDSEAIWYNPAGLGGNNLTRLDISGTVFQLRLQKISNGIDVTLPSGDHTDDLKGNEYFAIPAALSFARNINDNVSYGIGVYVPQYSDASYNSSLSSVETFSDIAESVNYEQGFDLDILDNLYNLGGAVGWKVNDKLRIGAGVFGLYERTRFNTNQFENISSADGSGNTSIFYVENARALVSTIGIRATGGVQYDINDNWRVGAVFFTPSFQIASWGQSSQMAAASDVEPGVAPASAAARDSRNIKEWEGKMVAPFHAQFSVSYEQPDYWIGVSGDIYAPLKTPSLMIDKKLNWNVCAGSKFKITEKIYGGAGFFTDNSDAGDPDVFGDAKINYYGLTFGGEFRTPIGRGESSGKPPIIFSTVLSGRYALGIGEVGGLMFDPVQDVNINNARVRKIDVYFNELSAYLGTGLYF